MIHIHTVQNTLIVSKISNSNLVNWKGEKLHTGKWHAIKFVKWVRDLYAYSPKKYRTLIAWYWRKHVAYPKQYHHRDW